MCDLTEDFTIKCMIVGDSLTGKTHLFNKFTKQPLPTKYVPTVFDISDLRVQSEKGCAVKLNLWDSAGLHVYDNIRPISYAHTDCFIVCYSISSKESFDNIYQRWIPEIKKHGDGPSVPIILVGTKLQTEIESFKKNENETNNLNDYITEVQGKVMQEKIGARAFYTCSASSEINYIELLRTTIDLAIIKKEEEDIPSDPIWKFCSPTVVFIGDSGVGKTSLLQACLKTDLVTIQNGKKRQDKLQEYYHNLVMDGCEYFIRFVEAQCVSENLSAVLDQANVVLLCYATSDPFSFQSAAQAFKSTYKDYLKRIPVILIGTKADLKNESMCVIPTVDGESLKEKMECATFIECSTITLENVSQVHGAILDNIHGLPCDKH